MAQQKHRCVLILFAIAPHTCSKLNSKRPPLFVLTIGGLLLCLHLAYSTLDTCAFSPAIFAADARSSSFLIMSSLSERTRLASPL